MRFKIAALVIGLACPVCELARGETASDTIAPAPPRVYALVAAISEQFSVVQAVSTTGTHLSPYRRSTAEVPNNILNRFALHSLNKAIAAIEPDSTRIYLSLPPAQMDGVPASKRDSVAIAAVVAALEKMPQRLEWDRIVVVTPAYRALDQGGLPSKLQGFGIFDEPRCQAGCFPSMRTSGSDSEPPDGVDAVTSEDRNIKARTYLAPFSYITVWVLDPKTLAVLDKQLSFESQKLAEPTYKPALDLSKDDVQEYLFRRVANLIEISVDEAVMHSEINLRRGIVTVSPVREVSPDEEKK